MICLRCLDDDEKRFVIELSKIIKLDGVRMREFDYRLRFTMESKATMRALTPPELWMQRFDGNLPLGLAPALLLGQATRAPYRPLQADGIA